MGQEWVNLLNPGEVISGRFGAGDIVGSGRRYVDDPLTHDEICAVLGVTLNGNRTPWEELRPAVKVEEYLLVQGYDQRTGRRSIREKILGVFSL